MSATKNIQLAKTLPSQLLKFFEKYPPPALLQTKPTPSSPAVEAAASSTAPSDPNASLNSTTAPSAEAGATQLVGLPLDRGNPFLPVKSYMTGRWRGPVYGLRKQKELVKLASEHGVLDLLPWTIKKPGEKEKRRIERKLQVKGTGEGQKVKGKLWERTLKGRLEMRNKAMLEMPALVEEWKQKGHGRGWKKWPSGKAKK